MLFRLCLYSPSVSALLFMSSTVRWFKQFISKENGLGKAKMQDLSNTLFLMALTSHFIRDLLFLSLLFS